MKSIGVRLLAVREQHAVQYVAVEIEGHVVCRTDTFEKAERLARALALLSEIERGEHLLIPAARRFEEAAD